MSSNSINKYIMMRYIGMGLMKKFSLLLVFTLVIFGCEQEPVLREKGSEQMVISEFIKDNPEFSEFAGIIEVTELNSLLSVRGPYTMFLPTNSAVEEYYKELGVASYLDIDIEQLKTMVMNHVVPAKIGSGEFSLGAFRETNGIDDYLVTEFEGAEILVNKDSKIIDRDVVVANGYIHVINKVIEPVERSVYDVVADNPSFSLFTQGLDATNLKDTLELIEFPYGRYTARTRFTVLAVADSTFNRYGITNFDEMVAYFTDEPDGITNMENGFYRFIEYHLLEGTHYLNNFEDDVNYPILSQDNYVAVDIDNDYMLNYKSGSYVGFGIPQSNLPAKNGTVHTLNDLLVVFQPKPVDLVLSTTNYLDVKLGDYYGKHYQRFFDGQNDFKYIKWEGDNLLYYYKDYNAPRQENWDCLCMHGWWWVEVTTPKIMKGKYKLRGYQWGGTSFAVYVDGEYSALMPIDSDDDPSLYWGTFEWDTTERHTVKLVTKTPGILFWDTIILEAI